MAENYKHYLLSFIATLTTCDHMGDVMNIIDFALDDLEIGEDWEWHDLNDLADRLAENGIKTIFGDALE